jgi:tetratricopeptide (TPR) repeat protein
MTDAERHEESLADYNQVLERDPSNIDARFYRGVVLERMGKLDQAISDFSVVLERDPNHIKASYARGACQNLKGEFAEAIRTLLSQARTRLPCARMIVVVTPHEACACLCGVSCVSICTGPVHETQA